MTLTFLFTFFVYAFFLGIITTIFYFKVHLKRDSFFLGDREVNPIIASLCLHASGLGIWIFSGYPGMIYTHGLSAIIVYAAVMIGMMYNWIWIAPRLRWASEYYRSITLSDFLSARYHDPKEHIAFFLSLFSLFFFVLYTAAEIKSLGQVIGWCFDFPYQGAMVLSTAHITLFAMWGGYKGLAWNNAVQAVCMLGGGIVALFAFLYEGSATNFKCPPLLQTTATNFVQDILAPALGWGLGYTGQAHILTHFMAMKKEDVHHGKKIGMWWQGLLGACATFIGIFAISYFSSRKIEPAECFIILSRELLSYPFMLCALFAIAASAITTVSAHLFTSATNIAEGAVHRFFPLYGIRASRTVGVLMSLLACTFALQTPYSMYHMAFYAWGGSASLFGPLLFFALYKNNIPRQAALAGMITAGFISLLFPFIAPHPWKTYVLFPASFFHILVTLSASSILRKRGYVAPRLPIEKMV